jgi:hypothetical protein
MGLGRRPRRKAAKCWGRDAPETKIREEKQ